jgi:hypothetical protein
VVKSTGHLFKRKLAKQDNGGRLRLEEGENEEDLNGGGGGRGEGAGVRRGPSGGRRGAGVDSTTVGEVVGVASR